MPEQPATPMVTVRMVMWPSAGDSHADPDVHPEEWRHFAEHYADVPLLELWRRLRKAEWNAEYYQGEAKEWQEIAKKTPPLHVIEETADRHRRLLSLLAQPGRISRSLLTAALAESDDTWNARHATASQDAA